MPRTHRQRPITYRDHQRRVWYVSEVARLKVVSPSIDGPNVALVIRFEREGEVRFARWIGGEDWRQRDALHRLFGEAEPVAPGTAVATPKPGVTDPAPVASPTPNDTGARDAGERILAPWEYQPQRALLVAEPPTGDRWLHELKLDGFRMGVLVAGRGKTREVMIISRNGTDYTAAFPEIAEAAMELRARAAVLDGELVVLDGEDLKPLPLEERKRRLEALIGSRAGVIRYTPHFDADGRTVLAQACRLGAEGIVSKCRTAPYRAGSRSDDWRKTKCVRRQEFVVGGFTEPEGSREGVGSILVGYYEGLAFRFAGKVGTGRGWNDTFGRELRALLESIQVDTTPFDPPPPGALAKRAHWVEPRFVAEVQFTEWTGDGKIRHPSLQGFRTDRRPADVRREREVDSTN